MQKRQLFIAAASLALLVGCTTTPTGITSGGSPSEKRHAIDAEVNSAMQDLYTEVPGSRAMVDSARGVLVFPSVVRAGFVVSGSYGQGALVMNGDPTDYFRHVAAPVGWLAGAKSEAVYVLFLTPEALQSFRQSKGWTIGAEQAAVFEDDLAQSDAVSVEAWESRPWSERALDLAASLFSSQL
jgi:lipid-binding SYLF domain-containing protein